MPNKSLLCRWQNLLKDTGLHCLVKAMLCCHSRATEQLGHPILHQRVLLLACKIAVEQVPVGVVMA